jgi:hypothetical protein
MRWIAVLVMLPVAGVFGELEVDTVFPDRYQAHAVEVYRTATLALRDPHFHDELFPGICSDITELFNGLIDSSLNNDDSGNGMLDASLILQLEPRGWPDGPGSLVLAEGQCTAPAETSACSVTEPGPSTWYESSADELCRAPIPGTVRPYSTPVPTITGPCFATPPATIELALDEIVLELKAATVAGSWLAIGQGSISPGLLRGFLSEDDADAIIIPPEIDIIGGQPLSALLPGGTGNCAAHSDMDELDGVSGWWFYFELAAESVPLLTD